MWPVSQWAGCVRDDDESLSKSWNMHMDDYCSAREGGVGHNRRSRILNARAASYTRYVWHQPSAGLRPGFVWPHWRRICRSTCSAEGQIYRRMSQGPSSAVITGCAAWTSGVHSRRGRAEESLWNGLDSLLTRIQSEKFTRELLPPTWRGCIGEYWHGKGAEAIR